MITRVSAVVTALAVTGATVPAAAAAAAHPNTAAAHPSAAASLTPSPAPAARAVTSAPAARVVPRPVAPAGVRHRRVVSEDPVDHTPHVLDGIVNAITMVGRTVVVGGAFTKVREAGGGPVLARSNVFAFDVRTGRVLPGFAPRVHGPVYALAAGPDGTVYLGGDFVTAGRGSGRALARLRLADGSAVPGFAPWVAGGPVRDLVVSGTKLYVGGDFSTAGGRPRDGLARLDATTGAADPAFSVTPGRPRSGGIKVYTLALAGDRLAVGGNFGTLDGLSRPQLGLIDVGGRVAKVAPWRTAAYAPSCSPRFPDAVRDVAFSPEGDYFVVVATGGIGGPQRLCDAAARFETRARGNAIQPTWVNHTGGDSLYAVAVTGAAVYVGGHQRWLNNPQGRDSAGPGAVERPGIGAIHPRTGKALRWNPTRERGVGVKAFLAHRGGLLVGSDTTRLGREYHARVGMFPLR